MIIVADISNADMELQCKAESLEQLNLGNAAGSIGYVKDSNRVIKYEAEENISPLFRVVDFSIDPPEGPPGSPISSFMEKVKGWLGGQLPEPETIYLTEYVEEPGKSIGTFTLPNNHTVVFCQKDVDAEEFLRKSELVAKTVKTGEAVVIETVQINKGEMSP